MTNLLFDTAAKMRRTLYLRGYVIPDGDIRPEVLAVRLKGAEFLLRFSATPPEHGSPANACLEVFAVALDEFDFAGVTVEVDVRTDGVLDTVVLDQETIDRQFLYPKYTVMSTWQDQINSGRIATMIDIGGRARSGISRKDLYPGTQISIADILAAPEVDYVADVHELSLHVGERFDAFMSIATFEHLLMPWKAAIEINKVLKDGGVGLVVTHQTTGIHDVPWDYLRFSDNAWKGVFNRYTGFEILDAGMALPAMIIPRRWQAAYEGTEHAVGFLTSAVVVRKISQPQLDWPVSIPSITADYYPE